MVEGYARTLELLKQLIASKKNLSDTLVSKGEEADFNEPFDDLVQKAADYVPKSYVFVDDKGNEITGALVSQEVIFDATPNDVREGKVFASEMGVEVGSKVIPAYHTTEGKKIIQSGKSYEIVLVGERYDFTKFQAIICPFNISLDKSVAAEKVAIEDGVYAVNSTEILATVMKNGDKKTIDLGITNDSETLYILRYLTYKEIY